MVVSTQSQADNPSQTELWYQHRVIPAWGRHSWVTRRWRSLHPSHGALSLVLIFSYFACCSGLNKTTTKKWAKLLDFAISIDVGGRDGHRMKISCSEEINKMLIGKLNPPQCCCLYDWNPKWGKLQHVLCCFRTPNAFSIYFLKHAGPLS